MRIERILKTMLERNDLASSRGPVRSESDNRQGARRPVSRVLSAPPARHGTAIPLGRASLRASRDQPGLRGETTPGGHPEGCRRPPLFGLAPGGVCRAAPVAGGAVRPCRTLSPLPAGPRGRGRAGGLLSVALSLRSPSPVVDRHRGPLEPGLSSTTGCDAGSSGRPAVWRRSLRPLGAWRQGGGLGQEGSSSFLKKRTKKLHSV